MTMNAAITGVGMSDIGRKTGRPAMAHLAEAAKRALECAGLTKEDDIHAADYCRLALAEKYSILSKNT